MMEKLTFGRHAAKQLVAQIDISQKKFYILFIKLDTPKYAKYGQICIFGSIFPTNQGYVSIEKWSQIFVSGNGSARTKSEENATFTLN